MSHSRTPSSEGDDGSKGGPALPLPTASVMDTRDTRRVPFIYQLLKDKLSLTSKCAELCKYVEQVEEAAKRRFAQRESALQTAADARLERCKADFRARHKIQIDRRAEAVRQECIEAFKPEVQRLLDRHAAELAAERAQHAQELDKARGAVPQQAAKLAGKQAVRVQRELAQVSAGKIAGLRSQWMDDRRRLERAMAAAAEEHREVVHRMAQEHSARLAEVQAAHAAQLEKQQREISQAERLRGAQDEVRQELKAQQDELATEMCVPVPNGRCQ
jgi:5-azacytidine-induced protein 1